MNQLKILFEDSDMVAIDKPSGFHVHPPEDSNHKISNQKNCLFLLARQLDLYLYPVHRLDPPTSGVLIFAKTKAAAAIISKQFRAQEIKKIYYGVCRGYLELAGQVDHDLDGKPSITKYTRLSQREWPVANSKYSSSRFSLVRLEPKSGRQHQIRRHLDHISHPLIGDRVYGKGEQNRIFTDLSGRKRLWLHAHKLTLEHPSKKNVLEIRSRFRSDWLNIFDLFEICPWD